MPHKLLNQFQFWPTPVASCLEASAFAMIGAFKSGDGCENLRRSEEGQEFSR
jgi:hypothetical protein